MTWTTSGDPDGGPVDPGLAASAAALLSALVREEPRPADADRAGTPPPAARPRPAAGPDPASDAARRRGGLFGRR